MSNVEYITQVAIYARTRDVPDANFVVREWRIERGPDQGSAPRLFALPEKYTFDELAQARAFIEQRWPRCDYCMPRSEDDDPVIVEVWI